MTIFIPVLYIWHVWTAHLEIDLQWGSDVPRGGWFGGSTHSPEITNVLQNRAKLNPIVKTVKKFLNLGRQHSQDVRKKKGSKILKLPPFRNCFTLAMTNKLVVIINCLKVPKIKKILLYKMKFLVPNYSCLQNPSIGGYRPPHTRSLCS